MAKRNIYEYDGLKFNSIKSLAIYSGKNEKTIQKRLQRGLSVTEACTSEDMRCHYTEVNGESMSISDICSARNKNSDLVYNRLNYGYTLDEALNTPKQITRQGKEVVVHGILYNSISSAIRELKMEEKESTIRRRLNQGQNPDEAFTFEKK